MTCQACHAAEATRRVTERTGPGQFAESHFCDACCRTLADLPDSPPTGLYTLVDRAIDGARKSRVVSLHELALALGLRPEDEPSDSIEG